MSSARLPEQKVFNLKISEFKLWNYLSFLKQKIQQQASQLKYLLLDVFY